MTFYRVVRAIGGTLLRLLMGHTVQGREQVPASGPIVICGNHCHWLDPLVLACSTERIIFFMAKHELFTNPMSRQFYSWLGAFSVRRGGVDRNAVRRCVELLRSDQMVGIFPEGTRSRTGKLGPGEPGAAVMGLMTGAKIVPAGILGYSRGQSLKVVWGQPLDPRDFGDADARRDRQVISSLTGAIMSQIATLTEQELPLTEPVR